MIRDLLALFDAVRSAQEGQEKTDRQDELDAAIRKDIARLFDDPAHEQGRRSFGAVRKAIPEAICDDTALTETLYRMGYRQVASKSRSGANVLWERLQEGPDAAGGSVDNETPPKPPRRPMRWQTLAAILGALAALATLFAWAEIGPCDLFPAFCTDPRPPTCDRTTLSIQEYSLCIGTIGGARP